MATEFMLAHPYGFTRVMSSYHWNRDFHGGEDHNNWQGPPHNGDMSIKGPSIQSDMSCSNGWVRIGTKQIEQGQIMTEVLKFFTCEIFTRLNNLV